MARVTKEHVDARRSQILEAAWTCFARRGYHQTKMQDIATEAGISAGAIYRYFPSKEAVLRAISERSLARDMDLIAGARSHSDEPIDALELLAAYVVTMFRSPNFVEDTRVQVELRGAMVREKKLRAEAKNSLDQLRTGIAAFMTDAQAKGQLKPDLDPEALAILSLALNEGLHVYNLIDPDNFRPEACFALLRQVLRPSEYTPAAPAQKESQP